VLYVYAIADSPPSGGLLGLGGSPLRTLGDGPFAVVSEHREPSMEAKADHLLAHEGVVEALMAESAILPVRFGTTLPDDAAVHALLRDRRDEFRSALANVRGAVELGVSAFGVEARGAEFPEPVGARMGAVSGPGTAYMLERLARVRQDERISEQVHEPLRALARDSRSTVDADEPRQLRAAYLVDRERVAEFEASVEQLEDDLDATIVCTGPWPPYSFSSVTPR
jgi:hypothetical protein